MFTRREFLKPLGVSAVMAALPGDMVAHPPAGHEDQTPPNGLRSRINLNGPWQRYINGEFYDHIEVPSAQHPFGYYQLKRTFLMPQLGSGERGILHFEAITYYGRAFINGKELGVLEPYTPFEFDATTHLQPGVNEVAVTICDLEPEPGGAGADEIELGINPGWEAYGGIIRDVYIELRNSTYVGNVRLAYELVSGCALAHCRLTSFISSTVAGTGTLRVSLLEGETEVASGERSLNVPVGSSDAEISFELKNPALWSPDRPNLYRLVTRLHMATGEDEYSCRTGFRQTETRGPDFYLNGEKIKLHGLSWLGTWKDQGFTLSRKQMALDMRGMKEMGCNFVRLHLFPQDRYMVELADELGMFVCEEPGYWQVDFTKMRRSLFQLGLDILARTIRRDWNSPAVFAWLLSNESRLTTETLKEGADLCRKLDPIRRFVSAANDMEPAKAKPMFDEAGLDFYSAHPYDLDPVAFNKACQGYGTGKPLIFDEWGGRAIGQSRMILARQADRILELMEKDQLAGEMFFSWNDFPEFSREDPEMVDGVCESGIVSESREIREQVLAQISMLFQKRRQLENSPGTPPRVESLRRVPWAAHSRFQPIDLQPLATDAAAQQSWAALEQTIAKTWEQSWLTRDQWKRTGEKFRFWEETPIGILGVRFQAPIIDGYVRPLVATPAFPQIQIPIGQKCKQLHILGQVTLPDGFPAAGKLAAAVGAYAVQYAGGKTGHVPLRNGFEVCSASLIYQASRIAPGTSVAQRAVTFVRDVARERYQVLLLSLETGGRLVESLTLSLNPEQPPLLLFAVTAELA